MHGEEEAENVAEFKIGVVFMIGVNLSTVDEIWEIKNPVCFYHLLIIS